MAEDLEKKSNPDKSPKRDSSGVLHFEFDESKIEEFKKLTAKYQAAVNKDIEERDRRAAQYWSKHWHELFIPMSY